MRLGSALLIFGLANSSPLWSANPQVPDGADLIRMASWPVVSPDGNSIVFEWRDDLWKVPSHGGEASRLTAHPARDSYPQFSPDGKTLYFSSTRAGALQVFSMPVDGGRATQHSFHSEGGVLECISPDGSTAIIRGLRDAPGHRPYRLIKINLFQDAPEEYAFDDRAYWPEWTPDARQLLFCRDGQQLYRKGYRGPQASSIWAYQAESGQFECLIKEEAEARWPLPTPDGRSFYYVTDRTGGFNLWRRRFDGTKDEQLTHFKDDGVMLPSLSKDGTLIAFRRGFDLWRYSPGKGKPARLKVWHSEDLPDWKTEVRDVSGTADCDFSKSGLEMVFKAEGELWTMDTLLREPNRITWSDGIEDDPIFAPDGNYIYYQYDDGIESNLWRLSKADPEDFWWRAQSFTQEQITFGPERKRQHSLSPDGRHLAWIAGSGDLTVADSDGNDPQVIFSCWDAPNYDWSPDGEWIVFSAQDINFNRDIYIIPTDGSQKPFNLTRHPDFEGSPRWSPDGSKIAFTGRRLNNEMGLFYVDLQVQEASRTSRDRRAMEAEAAMKDDPSYQQDQTHDDEQPELAAKPDELSLPSKPKASKSPTERLTIDFEGLSDRIVRLETRGIEPIRVIWSEDSERILFQSKNSTNDTLYQVAAEPKARMKDYDDHRGIPIRINEDGKLFWIVDGSPSMLDDGKLKSYDIEARMIRDRVAHQQLCYRLVWRTLRDRFYDREMNGLDWDKIRTKYESIASRAPDSRTFDRVIAMLLGELNASHMGFASEDWPEPWKNEGAEFQTTRHVGVLFGRDGGNKPLRIAKVLTDSPAAIAAPRIQVGDLVTHVNGRPVDSSTPIPRFMNGRMDRPVELTIRNAEGAEHTHELKPISYDKATDLAKADVIADNRRKVEELSGGRLGYVHIARMMWDQFEQFERQIYDAGHGKEGLVIDIRDNGGGFITDHLLTVLCQPRHAVTIPRDGGPGYPQGRKVYASWHKPLVVICNQNSFSNAEIFAHAIKTLDRGKLVGVQTAGGVISTARDRILDAGTLRVPFRGWFLPESGEDMEMHGAMPDIVVDVGPADLAAGRDPQLKTAVETLLEDVAQSTEQPFKPVYRNR